MSNVPGHHPGFHIPGTTTPIGAIAGQRFGQQQPHPSSGPKFEAAQAEAVNKADALLRASISRFVANTSPTTARPFVEYVRTADEVRRRSGVLLRPSTVRVNERTEYRQQYWGWVAAGVGSNAQIYRGPHNAHVRFAVTTDETPMFVLIHEGRVRVGHVEFVPVLGTIRGNLFKEVTGGLGLRPHVTLTPANVEREYAGLASMIASDLESGRRFLAGRATEQVVHGLQDGAAQQSRSESSRSSPVDVSVRGSRGEPRKLNVNQLRKVRSLRGEVRALQDSCSGGIYGLSSDPSSRNAQAKAQRDVEKLKAKISRITGVAE